MKPRLRNSSRLRLSFHYSKPRKNSEQGLKFSSRDIRVFKTKNHNLFWLCGENPTLTLVRQQGPEFNGYLVGRGNSRDIDLNRNFPDLNALMYYYEKTNGRNHHLPLPDNWEQQVSQCCWETQDPHPHILPHPCAK